MPKKFKVGQTNFIVGNPISVYPSDWSGDKEEKPLFILEWKAIEIQDGVKIGKVSVDYSTE